MEINLTDDQMQDNKIKELYFRDRLYKIGFRPDAIDIIVSQTDLNKITPGNMQSLKKRFDCLFIDIISKGDT